MGQLELVVEPFEVGLQIGEPVLVCAEELLGLVAFGGGDDYARVVLIPARDWVRLRIPFTDYPDRSVYHCHILDHEDLGMMGTINVHG